MPETNDPSAGWDGGKPGKRRQPAGGHPRRSPRGHASARHHAAPRGRPRAIRPGRWHASATARAGNDAKAGPTPHAGHVAGAALPATTLRAAAVAPAALHGVAGVLLDLAGEGAIGLGHALAAWQGEQTRITNRTWRRPGGLARMGGL